MQLRNDTTITKNLIVWVKDYRDSEPSWALQGSGNQSHHLSIERLSTIAPPEGQTCGLSRKRGLLHLVQCILVFDFLTSVTA